MLYCIDSSIVIEYAKVYPPDVFLGPWRDLETLVVSQRLCAPEQVFKELEDGGDAAAEWAKRHKKAIVAKASPGMIALTSDVVNSFPNAEWTDATKDVADPWVIGLARSHVSSGRPCSVLTMEKLRGNKVKIPFVCQHYSLPSLDHFGLMRAEGWRY